MNLGPPSVSSSKTGQLQVEHDTNQAINDAFIDMRSEAYKTNTDMKSITDSLATSSQDIR